MANPSCPGDTSGAFDGSAASSPNPPHRPIRADAKQRRAKGGQDRAAVLSHIAGKISAGFTPTKKPVSKAAKELEIIRKTIVDGQKLGDG